MTLTREFVFAYLFEAMQDTLSLASYQLLADKRQFRCSNDKGFKDLILAVSPYDDAVLVELHLGLRLDAVEGIVQRFTRTLPGFYPDAHTVILSEGKLQGKPYLRHSVQDTDELDRLVHHLIGFWAEQGKPFLDDHFDLRGVDRLLNGSPDQPSPYLPNPAHRYLKGLVVARLLQRPDFEPLAQAYAEGLSRTPTGSLLMEGYQRLLGYLRHLSVN